MFLHVNLLHLLFNMYVLYLIGPQLERLFGHVRYLVLYLVAGLGGSVASFWFSDPHSVSAGASGAIFGLMAALVVAGHAVKGRRPAGPRADRDQPRRSASWWAGSTGGPISGGS